MNEKKLNVLPIRVSPGAKRAGIEGVFDGKWIKIALQTPPVDGRANEALIAFLADYLNVRRGNIEIVSGHTSRLKRVKIMEQSPRIRELSEMLGKG
ncbi:MAG: DUF167 domain-containing protein [Lactobacillales bacterium]|jgi:uncharacterized protein (TIGR00251 family)|nr:DUF167 domain-containing protein [Lactobacillales bacterium]